MGQRISLKAIDPAADPEFSRQVLELVSAKIARVEERMKNGITKGTLAPHQVALLALFDLAEDHLAAMKSVLSYQNRIAERSERILALLDEKNG